jgi:hypothetical protein
MTCVPHKSVVGILMYVMVFTRPDIAHVVGVLRRYMLTLEKEHKTTIKRVFKYLCCTKNYVICYQGNPKVDSEVNVHVFFNVNWVGNLNRQRLTIEYVFKMLSGAIRWMSKR